MDHPPDKCSKSVEREHLFVPCDNYSTCQGCLQEHEWTPGFQQLYHWSNQAKACPHKVRLCPLDGVKMLFKCVGSLIIIFHHLSMADRGALFVKYWSVMGPSVPWLRIKVPFKRKRFGPRWSDAFDMFTCNQWAPVHWSPFNNWWAIIRYWRMHKKYLVYPPREGLQCDRPCWLRVKASILGEDYPGVVLGHSSVCGQVTPGPCTGTLHRDPAPAIFLSIKTFTSAWNQILSSLSTSEREMASSAKCCSPTARQSEWTVNRFRHFVYRLNSTNVFFVSSVHISGSVLFQVR